MCFSKKEEGNDESNPNLKEQKEDYQREHRGQLAPSQQRHRCAGRQLSKKDL